MSNIFNFKRFGMLLSADCKKYFKNYGITLAIICGLVLLPWLLSLIFGFTIPTLFRWMAIYVSVFLTTILVPAKAFGDINLPREGVRYAMLPVSNLEKYLSYVFFCLMTPVIVCLCCWGLDSLLTLIPYGGFTHYIRHFGLAGIMQDFFKEAGELVNIEVSGDFDVDMPELELPGFSSRFNSGYIYSVIVGLIFQVGFFMLGNLMFKTHKTGKTFGIMLGISYVLTMIMEIFLFAKGIFPWMSENAANPTPDFSAFNDMIGTGMIVSNVLYTILTIALYVGIYFKLKNQKY